jgi:sulfane dehydrogenase subunit SoxC
LSDAAATARRCSRNAGAGHRAGAAGLVSCAEWTGVMLSTLLEEAGIDPKAKAIAEGAIRWR